MVTLSNSAAWPTERLLQELEDIDANTLTGDNSDPQKMEAVLQCFSKIESLVEERYADKHQRPSASVPANS